MHIFHLLSTVFIARSALAKVSLHPSAKNIKSGYNHFGGLSPESNGVYENNNVIARAFSIVDEGAVSIHKNQLCLS